MNFFRKYPVRQWPQVCLGLAVGFVAYPLAGIGWLLMQPSRAADWFIKRDSKRPLPAKVAAAERARMSRQYVEFAIKNLCLPFVDHPGENDRFRKERLVRERAVDLEVQFLFPELSQQKKAALASLKTLRNIVQEGASREGLGFDRATSERLMRSAEEGYIEARRVVTDECFLGFLTEVQREIVMAEFLPVKFPD